MSKLIFQGISYVNLSRMWKCNFHGISHVNITDEGIELPRDLPREFDAVMRPGSDDSIPRTRYPFSRLCPRPIHRTVEVKHIAVVTEEVEGGAT